MKKIILTFIYIIISQVLLLPVYFIGIMATGFNDTGTKINIEQLSDIISIVSILIIPVGIILLPVLGVYFVLRKIKANKLILNIIYIPINLILIVFTLCCYISSFTNIDALSIFGENKTQQETHDRIEDENRDRIEAKNQEKLKTQEQLKKSYSLEYKDGVLYRSGSIGDNIGWRIYRDDKEILHRLARDELKLDTNDLKEFFSHKGNYRCYLAGSYDREYIPFSNEVAWEVK